MECSGRLGRSLSPLFGRSIRSAEIEPRSLATVHRVNRTHGRVEHRSVYVGHPAWLEGILHPGRARDALYPIPYTLYPVDIMKGEQRAPAYVKLNPNAKIPTIVDHDAGDFTVFESGAILIYLA